MLSFAQGFDVSFEVFCDVWERAVTCASLTLSRWSARAPVPSYTAPQLGRRSSPPSWRVLLSCCCAENLLLAASAHAEHMPPLQLCGHKHKGWTKAKIFYWYCMPEQHFNKGYKTLKSLASTNCLGKCLALNMANTTVELNSSAESSKIFHRPVALHRVTGCTVDIKYWLIQLSFVKPKNNILCQKMQFCDISV